MDAALYPTLRETRAKERQRATARARRQGAVVLKTLRHANIRARIVGSVARHRARADSDIDVLILDRGRVDPLEVVRLVESVEGDFPVDVVFSERLPKMALHLMIEESLNEPIVRPH